MRGTFAARPGESRTVRWAAVLGVGAVAAALRLPALDRPPVLVFDETYYVKDAWTLLHLGYEAQWGTEPDPAFEAGQVDGYSTTPAYVVHPPVGKWVIAAGLRLFGAQDPVGWRIGTVVAGVVAAMLITVIARHLIGSLPFAVAAGLLLSIDGTAIVMSRTALLDGVLMTFVLAALAALVLDRTAARRRWAEHGPPRAAQRFGPWSWLRPWRVVAGVMLGLAVGTKWSGLVFLAAFGLLTVGWDAADRYRAGVRRWWQGTLLRDAGPAFLSIVPVALATYLTSWAGWLTSTDGYGRGWALAHPGQGAAWLPEPLRALLKYHQDMWGFHTNLEAEHDYATHPAGWLLQLRPTSFHYFAPEPAQQFCGADRCSQAVTSLGNPLIWWLGTLALAVCLVWLARRRDGVALVAVVGVGAGWLPWFAYTERTIFTFYAVVLVPFLVLALTWVCASLWRRASPRARSWLAAAFAAAALLVAAASVFFWPVWTAETITFRQWQMHQWLSSWV